MKTFFAIVALALVVIGAQALTDEQKEKIILTNRECTAETGVNPELVLKARRGEFVEDPKLKEHLLCFGKKTGFLSDAGEIQIEVLRKKINNEINDEKVTNELVTKCAIKKATPQDTAFFAVKCYKESSPNHSSLA